MAETRVALKRIDRIYKKLDPDVPIFTLTRGTIRVLRQHAPFRTGNLKAGIGVIEGRRGQSATVGVSLSATARRPNKVAGPTRPFDYVRITRFGHKVAVIYPKQLRGDASVLATGSRRRKGRRGALRVQFTPGGGAFYFDSVKGYRPKSDWVADAGPEIAAELRRVSLEYKRQLRGL